MMRSETTTPEMFPDSRQGRQPIDGLERIVRLAGATWAEIEYRILERCGRLLASRSDIDPRDACQEVLVIILCRGFLMRFDPRKGTFWHYVEGIIRYECLHLLRQSKRSAVRLDSVEEPVARPRAFDPVAAAMDREFREALSAAGEDLTPAERSVFGDVVERAEIGRCNCRPGNSMRHARESRCRLRLRSLLIDYADE